ncbi:hypothetical protein [Kitasatospora sp. NPDC098663]|uniref:hypothetical protein n=1 Tax=Kitasatospora sp. NPDC098663 TaxID=3364096 RepID=UPI0038252F09
MCNCEQDIYTVIVECDGSDYLRRQYAVIVNTPGPHVARLGAVKVIEGEAEEDLHGLMPDEPIEAVWTFRGLPHDLGNAPNLRDARTSPKESK